MKKTILILVVLAAVVGGCIDLSRLNEPQKELKPNNQQIDTSFPSWLQFNKAQEIIGKCPDSIISVSGYGSKHYNDNGPGLSGTYEFLIDNKDSSLYIAIEETTNSGYKILDAVRLKGIKTRPINNSIGGFSLERKSYVEIQDYNSEKKKIKLTFFMDFKNKKIVRVKNKNI